MIDRSFYRKIKNFFYFILFSIGVIAFMFSVINFGIILMNNQSFIWSLLYITIVFFILLYFLIEKDD